jgi:hypothetical protein
MTKNHFLLEEETRQENSIKDYDIAARNLNKQQTSYILQTNKSMAKVGQKLQKNSGREAVTSFFQGKEYCLFLVEVRGWGSI